MKGYTSRLILFRYLREKKFRMIWHVEKGEKKNYLAGTAHFFPHSFKRSLEDYISGVATILLEGPLDEKNMNEVREYGSGGEDTPSLYDTLDRDVITKINRELESRLSTNSDSVLSYIQALKSEKKDALYSEIEGLRPWMAFFKIWSLFLQKRGWKYSVDMEVFKIAVEMGKKIHFLETIEEQLTALNGIPLERIANYLKKIDMWERFSKGHKKYYLMGELGAMLNITTEFPTRCESIVEKRDPVLFERARPFFEEGGAILFVGTTHVKGISRMFEEDGYIITKVGE